MTRWGDLARTILSTITSEYPNDLRHIITGPDDRPTPREAHPAFYGSFDWHSCVEMHWALVRLLRIAPDDVPADEIRTVLSGHLTAGNLAAETAYLVDRPGFKRPYGRGWALALVHELGLLGNPAWSANAAPMGEAIATNFAGWLPRMRYPVRYGIHDNTAFGLSRALPYARANPGTGLADGIAAAARRWFGGDTGYPAAWEPSGADFLSPALTEATLMAECLAPEEFAAWFDRFLPDLPPALTEPAGVSDPTDGQIAHLAGLNFSRAHGFKKVAAALPDGHPRGPALRQAAARHDEAAMPYATGGDYMVEHWLACYAVLSLS